MTPCLWVSGSRLVEGSWLTHLQRVFGQGEIGVLFLHFLPLKVQAPLTSEALETTHPKSRRYIPEALKPQQYRYGSLLSRLTFSSLQSVKQPDDRANF